MPVKEEDTQQENQGEAWGQRQVHDSWVIEQTWRSCRPKGKDGLASVHSRERRAIEATEMQIEQREDRSVSMRGLTTRLALYPTWMPSRLFLGFQAVNQHCLSIPSPARTRCISEGPISQREQRQQIGWIGSRT